MIQPFQNSAEFYELIYQKKDYKKEASYIFDLLNSLKFELKGEVLDIGCGTGGYLPFFLKKNVKLTGLDNSKEMLAIAKPKFKEVTFILGDVSTIQFFVKFHFAFMMFHVINYQRTMAEILKTFQNISSQMHINGVLVFDFWHGQAIEKDPPKNVEKEFCDNHLKLIRKTTPKVQDSSKTVDVCFDYFVFKEGIQVQQFQEHHYMRYLYINELRESLEQSGFEICLINGWLKYENITSEDWFGIVIARKIK